jgi:hypothetical protein
MIYLPKKGFKFVFTKLYRFSEANKKKRKKKKKKKRKEKKKERGKQTDISFSKQTFLIFLFDTS